MLRLHPSPLKCFAAILVLTLSLLCAAGANAQSTYGTLLGTVKDTSGALVAGAAVTVTESTTNISKTVTTDDRGDYQLPNLLAGTYDVTVTATGFKQFLRRGVPLDPRAEVRVDASLQVGETHTTVEVTGSAPVIATETATVDDVAKGKEISQLPINYRANSTSPFSAITTIPGVQVDSGGALGSASFSVSGNHPSQNEVSVDGFSVTSPRSNGPIAEMFPSTEQISELKVTSQIANAEYGQVGDIAFIGKSGSNTYHGSAFEYMQNDAFDANVPVLNFQPGDAPNTKAKKRNTDFGGSFAGPVRLPFYDGRDHTFFFVDFERNVQHTESIKRNKVPTPGMISGDFAYLLAAGTQLINPFTGAPFVNNQIPTAMLNPTSLKILDRIFPAPTVPNVDPLTGVDNYIVNLPAPISTNLYDIRIDRVLTKKQSLFGRFSWKKSTASSPQAFGTKTGPVDSIVDPKAFVVSHNYAIHQDLLNEFRFGINKQRSLSTFPKFPNGAALIADLGLQQLGTLPTTSGLPDFNFSGHTSNSPGGRANTLREKKIQIADNLTWIRGRHTIKTGFDLRTLGVAQTESFIEADNFGDYFFSSQYTGDDFADFLLGLPTSTQIVNAGPDFDGHARAYAFFGQDSFKVTPKLSIEFGLRYEYHPPFHDNTLQIANFDRANGSVVVPNAASLALATPAFLQSINACSLATPNPPSYGIFPCTPVITAAQDGIPESLRKSDKRKFLPRLGLAYRVNGKTVVRAGAGLYDETLLGTIFYSLTGIHTSPFQEFDNTPGFPSTPAIVFPNTKSSIVNNGSTGPPAGDATFGTANQIDLRDPYGEQWSLTVERDLGYSTGLRVTYTGLRSVGLVVSPDLNQIQPQSTLYDPTEKPFPNWNVIKTRDNGGYSFYNGLETVVTHRFSSGFFFQSSWVWSKNLSNAEGDDPNAGFANENGPRLTNRFNHRADYGDVTYTRRHRWLTTANIELPFGRGRKFGSNMNRFLDAVLGGWRNSDILIVQTGPFLTPTYSDNLDPSGTNANNRPGSQRPDVLPLSACNGLLSSQGQAFQGKCFFYDWGLITSGPNKGKHLPIGRFGNAGVGILHGAGAVIWNTGLAKDFALTERLKLRFESTFTNALNHVNPGVFDTTANNAGSFGIAKSPQGVEGAGVRNIQFGLRLDF